MGRSWAGPVSLFSPTLANGVIVLGWEGPGALAWELLGTCPEGHRGGRSFFAWPQNGLLCSDTDGSGHSGATWCSFFQLLGVQGIGAPPKAL